MKGPRSFLAWSICAVGLPAAAQTLQGVLHASVLPHQVVLWTTEGQEHSPLDSARLDAHGRFGFKAKRYEEGFYQLSVGDSDRVEVILTGREDLVQLEFDGRPLREHIAVTRSLENQRLWEYKRAGRAFKEESDALQRRRGTTDPRDTGALVALDSLERHARARREAVLARMVSQDSTSYFARVVRSDARLMAAIPNGTKAIRDAIDWRDAGLTHSAVYPKAVLAVLQSAAPATADVMMNACDSLLRWSEATPSCWKYMRKLLVRTFAEYSADEVVQHLVDRYVVGGGARVPPEPELLGVVAAQLRVSTGSQAPDVLLPSPLRGDTVHLSEAIQGARCAALFFYSSTCDHCHEQMPGLQTLYNEFHDKGFEVIGVALDDRREDFIHTIVEEGLTFPCFSELNAWGSAAARAFAVKATPTFLILDASGTIVGKPFDHQELRSMVVPLLAK